MPKKSSIRGTSSRKRQRPEPKRKSSASSTGSAFRVGQLIVEKVSGQPGRITADFTENLTYEPGSYECDLGHGYLVVRHRSEIEGMPNDKVSGPPPVTPESKQSATGGFAAPNC